MNSVVVVANREGAACLAMEAALGPRYGVRIVTDAEALAAAVEDASALVLDTNFSENQGIDCLMDVLARTQLPVLMITPSGDSRCAVEALRSGAMAYLVKTGDYLELVRIALDELLARSERVEDLKRTIVSLRQELSEAKRTPAKGPPVRMQSGSGNGEPSTRSKGALMSEVMRRLASEDLLIPAYPRIAAGFRQLAAKPNASTQEVSRLVSQDAAISARLLRLANSSLYGGGGSVKTIEQTIARLGLATTGAMVEVVTNRSMYVASNRVWRSQFEQLLELNLSCAWASQRLAERAGSADPASLFGVGLLLNVGRLLLLKLMAETDPEGGLLNSIEDVRDWQAFVEKHQGRFGAAMFTRWGFGEPYQVAALHAADPESAPGITKDLMILHLAGRIGASLPSGSLPNDLEHGAAARFLRLDQSALSEVRVQVEEALAACRSALGDK